MLNIYCLCFFTHHLLSGDRRVIGDRCGDRLTATYHHALNPDEQGRSWFPVIGDRGKCEKLLCISVLPASLFFSLRAHIRTHEYNNVPFLPAFFPPHPFFKKKCPVTSLCFSGLSFPFQKTSKNSGIYLERIRKASTFAPAFRERTALRN